VVLEVFHQRVAGPILAVAITTRDPATGLCRDRRRRTRDPGSQKTFCIRAIASTRSAERARWRVSRWWIGRYRYGDYSDPGNNQTSTHPVLATEGFTE